MFNKPLFNNSPTSVQFSIERSVGLSSAAIYSFQFTVSFSSIIYNFELRISSGAYGVDYKTSLLFYKKKRRNRTNAKLSELLKKFKLRVVTNFFHLERVNKTGRPLDRFEISEC